MNICQLLGNGSLMFLASFKSDILEVTERGILSTNVRSRFNDVIIRIEVGVSNSNSSAALWLD